MLSCLSCETLPSLVDSVGVGYSIQRAAPVAIQDISIENHLELNLANYRFESFSVAQSFWLFLREYDNIETLSQLKWKAI